MFIRWFQSLRLIGLLILGILVIVSCQSGSMENKAREVALCGQGRDNVIRVYHISISDVQAVTLTQVINLPGNDFVRGSPCPHWLDDNTAWLYGNATDNYERDVYLLDLTSGQISPWFSLSGNDDIKDAILKSGSPQALVISSRDGHDCSQYNSPESHWMCLYSRGDLYIVDQSGETSRLTDGQSPLCEAAFSPDGRVVTFRQSMSCTGHHPEEPSNIFLVDTQTKQISSFDGNQGVSQRWSPDSQYLAFFSHAPSSSSSSHPLYIFDVSKSQLTLINDDPNARRPHWSPDSKYLAWATTWSDVSPEGITSRSRVTVFDVAHQTKMVFPGPAGTYLQWSPDESHLAWRTASGFYFAALDSTDVYSVSVEASSVYPWSFDGESVVYFDQREKNNVLIMNRNSQEIISLTDELVLGDIDWLGVAWLKK